MACKFIERLSFGSINGNRIVSVFRSPSYPVGDQGGEAVQVKTLDEVVTI